MTATTTGWTMAAYGLYGDFGGDDRRMQRVVDCAVAHDCAVNPIVVVDPTTTTTTVPSTRVRRQWSIQEWISFLSDLPDSGRRAVALKIIVPSPYCMDIVEALYHHCLSSSSSSSTTTTTTAINKQESEKGNEFTPLLGNNSDNDNDNDANESDAASVGSTLSSSWLSVGGGDGVVAAEDDFVLLGLDITTTTTTTTTTTIAEPAATIQFTEPPWPPPPPPCLWGARAFVFASVVLPVLQQLIMVSENNNNNNDSSSVKQQRRSCGLRLARHYVEQTVSQRYRAAVLELLIRYGGRSSLDDDGCCYSNADVIQALQQAPTALQRRMIKACTVTPGREAVFEVWLDQSTTRWISSSSKASSLLTEDNIKNNTQNNDQWMYHYCSTPYLEQYMRRADDHVDKAKDKLPQLPLLRWQVHGNMYCSYIRDCLIRVQHDPILCGATLRTILCDRIPDSNWADMSAKHATLILLLYQEFQPIQFMEQSSQHAFVQDGHPIPSSAVNQIQTYLKQESALGHDLTSYMYRPDRDRRRRRNRFDQGFSTIEDEKDWTAWMDFWEHDEHKAGDYVQQAYLERMFPDPRLWRRLSSMERRTRLATTIRSGDIDSFERMWSGSNNSIGLFHWRKRTTEWMRAATVCFQQAAGHHLWTVLLLERLHLWTVLLLLRTNATSDPGLSVQVGSHIHLLHDFVMGWQKQQHQQHTKCRFDAHLAAAGAWQDLQERACPTNDFLNSDPMMTLLQVVTKYQPGPPLHPQLLWKIWWNNVGPSPTIVAKAIEMFLQVQQEFRHQLRSKVTLHANYVMRLLQWALRYHARSSSSSSVHPDVKDDTITAKMRQEIGEGRRRKEIVLLKGLEPFVSMLYGKIDGTKGLQVVQNLERFMSDAVEDLCLPALGNLLKFGGLSSTSDINQGSSDSIFLEYITRARLLQWSQWMDWITAGAKSLNVLIQCQDVSEKVIADAQFENRHVPLPDDRLHFVERQDSKTGRKALFFFDSVLHGQSIQAAVDHVMIPILKKRSNQISGNDKDDGWNEKLAALQTRVWKSAYANKWKSSSNDDFVKFYFDVLPSHIRSDQEQEMIRRSLAILESLHLERMSVHHARSIHVLSLLSTNGLAEALIEKHVLTNKHLSEEMRLVLITRYGTFANPGTREILRSKMNNRLSDIRAEAHIAWLNAAHVTKSAALIAEALTYTAKLIRNEAGPNRREVYNWFSLPNSWVSDQIVTPCLKQKDLESAKQIAQALIKMFQDDLARRDSVGRANFISIAQEICRAALFYCPEELANDLRQVWISCSLQLAWMAGKTMGDTNGLLTFQWPLLLFPREALPSSTWIDETSFDQHYPLAESGQAIAMLRHKFNLTEVVRTSDETKTFGPRHAVKMLVDALDAVWEKRLPVRPLRPIGSSYLHSISKDAEISQGLFMRLQVMFHLCGIAWEESSLLAAIFDEIYSSSADLVAVEDHQFKWASQLLMSIFEFYGGTYSESFQSLFFTSPRLAMGCANIYEAAIARGDSDIASLYFIPWKHMMLGQGSRSWSLDQTTLRFRGFLVQYAWKCEPPGSVLKVNSKIGHCQMAQKMIQMDINLALNADCAAILLKIRQDVLSELLVSTNDVVLRQGLLAQIKPNELTFFNADVGDMFARYILERSFDQSLSMLERTRSIEAFMAVPSIDRVQVMEILRRNDLEPTLLEAMVLRLFSLDSPWHMMAYLFSPEALGNRQHAIGSLLSHVAKHIHASKVISILEVLLTTSRRHLLRISLHKAIIRMLFDELATTHSKALLQAEWDNDHLHVDVRHLMLALLLRSAIEKRDSVEWEWEILSRLASGVRLDESTALTVLYPVVETCLLQRLWDLPDDISHDEDLNRLVSSFDQQIGQAGGCRVRRQRFRYWLRTMSQNLPFPGLQRIARYAHWSLCVGFDIDQDQQEEDTENCISSCLSEMKEALLSDHTTWDEQVCATWTYAVGKLYGAGVVAVVQRSVTSKNKKRQPGDSSISDPPPSWEEECVANPRALEGAQLIHCASGELYHGQPFQRRMQLWEALRGFDETGSQVMQHLTSTQVKEEMRKLNKEFASARGFAERYGS